MYRHVWVRSPVFAYLPLDDTHLTLISCCVAKLVFTVPLVRCTLRVGVVAVHICVHIISKPMALFTVNIWLTGIGEAY